MPRSGRRLSAAGHGGFAEAVGSQSGPTGCSFLPGKGPAREFRVQGGADGLRLGRVPAAKATDKSEISASDLPWV